MKRATIDVAMIALSLLTLAVTIGLAYWIELDAARELGGGVDLFFWVFIPVLSALRFALGAIAFSTRVISRRFVIGVLVWAVSIIVAIVYVLQL